MEAAIAALAERQHGVVARVQLVRLGLGHKAIDSWLRMGRLHLVHRGVYALGRRRLTLEGMWMAAVLAGGPGAVLSHRSAAMLWGFRRTDRALIEITAPACGRGRAGIERHRSALPPDEVTMHRGIPVTTVPRTLLDLAAVLSPRQLARALNEAEVLRLGDRLSLSAVVERHPNRQGVPAIRALMESVDASVTRRELEKRFLEFIADFGLPRPETNAHIYAGGRWFEVDCLWRSQRLVLELDGRATHATRAAFENDRLRDRILQVAGWRIVRITWRQLQDSPAAMAEDLRALLGLA